MASSFDRITMAVADMQAGAGAPIGNLRINLSRLAADIFVLPRMAQFVRAFPEVRLELFVDDRLSDVVGAGFDAGIQLGSALESDMISLPLNPPLRRSVLASPGYLAAHGTPAHPHDLLAHRAIRYRYPGNGRLESWRFRETE